jgi:predicted glycogen debranching enzyme
MGAADGTRTRRYHGLRCSALHPPSDRRLSLVGVEAWVDVDGRSHALSSHRYAGGDGEVIHPDGAQRIARFTHRPWPTWDYALPQLNVRFELLVPHDVSASILRWTADRPAQLRLRPMLAGRDFHSLQRRNGAFRFGLRGAPGRWWFRAYDDQPELVVDTDGTYTHDPRWFLDFTYADERARGLDDGEDLASPGEFTLSLAPDEPTHWAASLEGVGDVASTVDAERTRRRPGSELERAMRAYVVRRGKGHTIIAGYPWFGDWGRDTFIALRGLRCLPEGPRLAAAILHEWAGAVSEGMLPNRFPDRGDRPEYNSVDASLWYVLAARDQEPYGFEPGSKDAVHAACRRILDGYTAGTRYGIRRDGDGLLAAGEPGVQLTWMDAKVGDWVVTPRIGKPVEVQALWLAALTYGRDGLHGPYDPEPGRQALQARFWSAERGYLIDVADVDHQPGQDDASFRPNQIFAVPWLAPEVGRAVVDAVEARLWTPLGLRSLAPEHAAYVPRYQGGVLQRDGAYHQGTVWPWLTGPFVDAWLAVRPDSPEVRAEARRRFVEPLLKHTAEAGLGHVSEIADAEAPHCPRGAPFQAWSVSELLRLCHRL